MLFSIVFATIALLFPISSLRIDLYALLTFFDLKFDKKKLINVKI